MIPGLGLVTTGEWHNSFAMLTINADMHPLFKEQHRPDLKRAPVKQDKHMVVILNDDSYDAWLDAPVEWSREFFVQYPADRLVAVGLPKPATADLLDS